MILYRIKQITADLCRTCNKIVHYQRMVDYVVVCWECGRGACPDCYPSNISAGKNWRYLCEHCLDVIGKLRGFNALQETDLLKPKKGKKSNKETKEPANEDTNEHIEVNEDEDTEKEENPTKDDSCVFVSESTTDDGGENLEEENPNNEDPSNAFEEQIVRGFKKQSNKTDENKENGKDNPKVKEDGKEKEKNDAKKNKTCSYFLQGRCHWGMSGKKPRKDVPNVTKECPYTHPRVCSKLLLHGDGKHTRYGCNGTNCKKAHPKMCVTSMKNRRCGKTCQSGFHLKDTIFEDGISMQTMQKDVQIKYNTESSQQFPPLSQMQQRSRRQAQFGEACQETPLPNFNVPPPKTSIDSNFKCIDCPAEFKFKRDLRHHINNEHNENDSKKEDSFLDAVQKTIEKLLPKVLENILHQSPPNHPTGSNMQNMRWGLIPTSLN